MSFEASRLRTRITGLFALLLAFSVCGVKETSAVAFTAGIQDNFAAPVDPASPSPEFRNAFVNQFPPSGPTNGFKGFDSAAIDSIFAHTFTGLSGTITSAILTIRVRAVGTVANGIDTDLIYLSFVDDPSVKIFDVFAYSRTFGSHPGDPSDSRFPADPGLLKSTAWSTGDEYTFNLDLSALPLVSGATLNLLPELQAKGFLDVSIGDETMVDYIALTAVPEPAVVTMFTIGLLTLFLAYRRKRFGAFS